MSQPGRVAVVYGNPPGVGGLGHSASAGISAAAKGAREVFALGPARQSQSWSLPTGAPHATWIDAPISNPSWVAQNIWRRWRPGRGAWLRDCELGQWAAGQLPGVRPDACYLFTQVALESLRWCRRESIPTVLDNPNGHIRNFREVCERESERWFGSRFHGHPSTAMVDRVEEEYELADRIRVYSEWGKQSMLRFGVPEDKIHVLRQTVNVERFRPRAERGPEQGALRVCYAGSLDLRKGFVYLLKAIRAVGAQKIQLRMVGATGDRPCAKLLERESAGLQIQVAPGDSLAAYQDSELLVVPTLEDGLPFVLVEGLACGLPVIVTTEAGASECVRDGQTGWLVPAGDVQALAAALEEALDRRQELWSMGQRARADLERYANVAQLDQLSDWFHGRTATVSSYS
jgi:glycosyltransferase involved in cell wall biosynthesis